MLQADIILPVYPKAPLHHAPEVHAMVLDRYLWLLRERRLRPEDIVLMGDSAGGGLTLSFLQQLRDKALPLPREAFLISPWLDVTDSNPAMKDYQAADPLLDMDELAFQGRQYAGDLDPKDPLVSPIFGSLAGLPPLTVFAGTHEIFYPDVIRLGELAREQGADIDIRLFPNQIHCFVVLPVREGKAAREIIERKTHGTTE
jgi:acetyl esterase/lipase